MKASIIGLLLCMPLLAQQAPPPGPTNNPAAQEQIRNLISSLALNGTWRSLMVGNHLTGDGIHHFWMDQMRKEGVALAVFSFVFNWSDHGQKLGPRTLASARYFSDYDEKLPISNQQQLAQIRSDGLQQQLVGEALERLNGVGWFERPPQRSGSASDVLSLADNEWLPVQAATFGHALFPRGLDPLERAAYFGDAEAIAKLLKEGSDVNQRGPDGCFALVWAAGGDQPAAVEALLRAGAHIDAMTKDWGTPLEAAVVLHRVQNVEILLRAGADPNVRSKDGDTALSIAMSHHSDDLVELLEKAGARQ